MSLLKKPFLILLCVCVFTVAASGQITRGGLKRLYGPPSDNSTYTVNAQARIKVESVSHGQICALTVIGAVTERSIEDIFRSVLPPSERGSKLQDLEECPGACLRSQVFEHAELSSAIANFGHQVEPSGYIVLRTSDCESALVRRPPMKYRITSNLMQPSSRK